MASDDRMSALERAAIIERDMSSPLYRAYLERQQALQGSHPEMMFSGLGALLRSGLNTARGIFGSRQAAPVLNEYQIAEMQRQAAFNTLTKEERALFNRDGTLPADWADRVKNASWIGSGVGKVQMPGSVKQTPQEMREQLSDTIFEKVAAPAVRRSVLELAPVKNYYEEQRQPTQEEVVQRLRGYAYGGMIPHAGNTKLL